MFHFACSIAFRMDVRNFFQFQCPFHGNRIVKLSAKKKPIAVFVIFFCNRLDMIVLGKHSPDLIRQDPNRPDRLHTFGKRQVLMSTQQNGQQCQDGQLRCKDLGGCHSDFRSGMIINTGFRLPGNGTAHNIDNAQQTRILSLCLPDCSKRISGFA